MTDDNDFRKKFNKELKTGLLGMLLLDIIARSSEPLYGYGMIKEMERSSNRNLILPEGTVYPILNSLETKGLLQSSWGKGKEGPRRKYYSITEKGKILLKEIKGDWRVVSSTINRMIGEEEVRS
jgi:PadR family transcriptional regulator PadR